MGGNAAFYSGHLFWLSVSYEYGNAGIRFGHRNIAAFVLSGLSGFPGVKVALAAFPVQDFSGSGFLESFLGALVGLHFRHWVTFRLRLI